MCYFTEQCTHQEPPPPSLVPGIQELEIPPPGGVIYDYHSSLEPSHPNSTVPGDEYLHQFDNHSEYDQSKFSNEEEYSHGKNDDYYGDYDKRQKHINSPSR